MTLLGDRFDITGSIGQSGTGSSCADTTVRPASRWRSRPRRARSLNEPSAPQRLFTLADRALSTSFVVAADGQRFLFARATGSDRVSVIVNWTRLAPK